MNSNIDMFNIQLKVPEQKQNSIFNNHVVSRLTVAIAGKARKTVDMTCYFVYVYIEIRLSRVHFNIINICLTLLICANAKAASAQLVLVKISLSGRRDALRYGTLVP